MKIRFVQIGLHALVILSFFFKIFNYHVGDERIPITGFEAIIKNEYFIIGNIMMILVLFISLFYIVSEIIAINKPEIYKKLDTPLMIFINLQLLTGLVVATFLGTYLEILGIAMVGLVVASAFIKHKFKL